VQGRPLEPPWIGIRDQPHRDPHPAQLSGAPRRAETVAVPHTRRPKASRVRPNRIIRCSSPPEISTGPAAECSARGAGFVFGPAVPGEPGRSAKRCGLARWRRSARSGGRWYPDPMIERAASSSLDRSRSAWSPAAQPPRSRKAQSWIGSLPARHPRAQPVWVFFTDKGDGRAAALTPRALARRARRGHVTSTPGRPGPAPAVRGRVAKLVSGCATSRAGSTRSVRKPPRTRSARWPPSPTWHGSTSCGAIGPGPNRSSRLPAHRSAWT
jgi:hypothetical protein